MLVTDILPVKTMRKYSLITLAKCFIRGYYGSKITVGTAISNFEIDGMFFLFNRSVNSIYLTECINQQLQATIYCYWNANKHPMVHARRSLNSCIEN
jgi:hypothetical protein